MPKASETKDYLQHNFWGLSASVLGTYEFLAFLTRKRAPTISTWASRKRHRRLAMVSWTIGLAMHIARHHPID